MGLQLKGDGEEKSEQSFDKGATSNPWDMGTKLEDVLEPVRVNNHSVAKAVGEDRSEVSPMVHIIKLICIFLVAGLVIFAGKQIVKMLTPEGKDITSLLSKGEADIAKELGITFTDAPDWVSRVHHYSNGTVTVHAAEDIGIIYLDGQRMGVQVESKAYTMFNVRVGQGEKKAYEEMTFPYSNSTSVLNDMAEGKTTTYYYYSDIRPDCFAIIINDTTNRIVGMTYFADYAKITERLE